MTLFEQLQRDEGLRLKVYNDSVGVPTIGYGRNLRDRGISQLEAERMLRSDIAEAELDVAEAFPWAFTHLDVVRRDALINMTFNMGIGGLKGFVKFLAFLRLGRWEAASLEMLDSKWARQVGQRAVRLSEQIRTGQYV